jgi:hypothetical protein
VALALRRFVGGGLVVLYLEALMHGGYYDVGEVVE